MYGLVNWTTLPSTEMPADRSNLVLVVTLSCCLLSMTLCLVSTGISRLMSQCWTSGRLLMLYHTRGYSGKLRHCGIDGLTLAWIESFLTGRSQRVIVHGVCSSWSPVLSAVPQRTVLGPLLFLIYINDLPDCVMSRVRLFADDCLIYHEIHHLEDQLALQNELDILEQWANKWGMQFNPGKCKILSISRSTPLHRFYSLCGTVLQNTDEARYLGINLSKDLQWGNHIQSTAAKSSSTLGLLKRNLSKCPQKLREQAYISLIRSRLEYCAEVWDPYLIKDINILEGIQRRAARFVIQDLSHFTSVSSLLKDLNWAPLKDRR